MWNASNVILELDGVLPDTCSALIVSREAWVDHLGAVKPLSAVDRATLTSDCIVPIER